MTRAHYNAQSRGWQPSSQELTDGGTDFGGMRFQREMPRVEKTHVGVANVALVGLGAWGLSSESTRRMRTTASQGAVNSLGVNL